MSKNGLIIALKLRCIWVILLVFFFFISKVKAVLVDSGIIAQVIFCAGCAIKECEVSLIAWNNILTFLCMPYFIIIIITFKFLRVLFDWIKLLQVIDASISGRNVFELKKPAMADVITVAFFDSVGRMNSDFLRTFQRSLVLLPCQLVQDFKVMLAQL